MRQVRTYRCRQRLAPTTRPTLDDGWAWVCTGAATDRIWYGLAGAWLADAVRTPRVGPDELVEWTEPAIYEGSRKMTSEETIRDSIDALKATYNAPVCYQPGESDLRHRLNRQSEILVWLAERELARSRAPSISCTDFNITSSANPQALSAYVQTEGAPYGRVRSHVPTGTAPPCASVEAFIGSPTGDIRANHGLE